MRGLGRTLARWAIPDLPRDIREDFVISAAKQVQKQAFWLFAALFLMTPLAALIAPDGADWPVAYGLPAAMAAYCLFGMLMLRRKLVFDGNPRLAERFIVESSISSCIGAVICTSWAVMSWLGGDGAERLHFPVILVMGALATAYCLASARLGAILHLLIDIVPIAAVLLVLGSTLDRAVAVSLVLAGLFQWNMINVHHRQVIELLRLKRHSQQLALTDSLTGLLNRRALLDFAEALGDGDPESRLVLIDIDRFKTINDAHGHEMGDRVLVEIAQIVERHAGNNVSAARLGGEEFALLGTPEALPAGTALALLDEFREAAMPHGEQVTISIGVAEGPLGDDEAWRRLYRRADEALYEAKRTGRNRVCHAGSVDLALPRRREGDRAPAQAAA